jgi:signal transduction histidine kinase
VRTSSTSSPASRSATIVLRNARLLEDVRLASDMKSEFVGAISHELRSPLNVILGYLEMILDRGLGAVTPGQDDALRRTQQQALALLEMITALLDMNRLEAGRLPRAAHRVSLKALLEEICQQLPGSWRRPEVTIELAVAPDVPTIETDAGKLKTVVRNLLHNALKFTTAGQVTVGAGLTEKGDVVIRVSDTGCGIPPDAIAYIFDMFRQVPGAGGGGVGLGLHLVRRLLQVLGGSIAVTSDVGRGTCFTITLPAAATVDTEPARGPDSARRVRLRTGSEASV